MQLLDEQLGLLPYEGFVRANKDTETITALNRPNMRQEYAIGREHWSVYKQVLLFLMAMNYDEEDSLPRDVVRLIVIQSFGRALLERLDIAVAKYGWFLVKCDDDCTYLTKSGNLYIGERHLWLRRFGFAIDLGGESFYVQDIFLRDDWMKERYIETRMKYLYHEQRRKVYVKHCAIIAFICLFYLDWLVFGFSLSEGLVDRLARWPNQSVLKDKLLYFVANPLRIIGKPSDEMLSHFSIVKEIVFTFFSSLRVVFNLLTRVILSILSC